MRGEGRAAWRLRVRGLVQGVGFRPHVWRQARAEGLHGWVRNDGAGVDALVQGPLPALHRFLEALSSEKPPLARIDGIDRVSVVPDDLPEDFAILDSVAGVVSTAIGPDAAPCPACLAEICDPDHRRWRYAFTTCTHCGPRYTVSAGIPYDRARTSLAAFPLCPTCTGEYTDPADRRFHAETTCCPRCGPRLSLWDGEGLPIDGDPLAATLACLQAGEIVAIKGLGGFHLVCDARQSEAVAALRQRKHREAKPLAVMGLNIASLADIADLSPAARELLSNPAAPIVLAAKGDTELPGIAPDLAQIGVMLPATPLHALLWHEAAGRPTGTDWLSQPHPLLLVMTSANPHGEPLVIDNQEALERLAGIADAYLVHDRAVVVRCDDSVIGIGSTGPTPFRLGRGHTPTPIALAEDGPPVLAVGAFLKNTVAVLRGREAFLSQHIGGLDNAAALAFQEEIVHHLLAILAVQPALIAHDLHPDYPATRLARVLADQWSIPTVAVAHHHAHIAALCAEHRECGPVLGLAMDGVGLGPDGGLWGGELLRVEGASCERLGHLQPLALPGGDRAAREPWRMAASALHSLGRGEDIVPFLSQRFPKLAIGPLPAMLDKGLNCPPCTSLGRLFDAAAGLLGLLPVSRYESQAAMHLESLAQAHGPVAPRPGAYRINGNTLDFRPLLAALSEEGDAARGAAIFHASLAAGLAEWLIDTARHYHLETVALGGGCALNQVLLGGLLPPLQAAGLRILTAHRAPPGDGGLALGQAWVARQQGLVHVP